MEFSSATHADHVRIMASGEFSPEAALQLFERSFQVAADAGCDAMLLDVRSVTGREPTMTERYQWAVHVAELQARHQPRIRVAVLGHEPLVHRERFGEIVAAHHGAVVGVFIDESLALEWLLRKGRRS